MPGLLGRAVGVNPGIVGAHGHDGEVEGARGLERAEGRGHGGIAAEEDAVAAGLDGVAVIAAVGIAAHAGAPVAHLEGADFERADLGALVPAEFVDGGVAVGRAAGRRSGRR